jgi:fucose 4-O-acetylase-like acetyltransferase
MRNYLLDNAKYLLVLMVVFGHMIEPILHVSPAIKTVYLFIYSFHIPAFVLISGALSKNILTGDGFLKLVKSILVPFVVFTVLYEFFSLFHEGEFSRSTKNFEPYWLLWFLYSLFIWKLLLPVFLNFSFPVLFSIVLSIGAGYLDSVGYSLGLSRTLYFFPFFILGYKLKPKLANHRRKIGVSMILLLGVLVLNISTFAYFHEMRQEWLYGSYSFSKLENYGLLAGIKRLLIYGVSFITALSVLMLVPDKKMAISEKGINSFHVYLWHGFFVKILSGIGLIAAIGQLPVASSLPILFILSLLLTLFLSKEYIAESTQRYLIGPANNLLLNRA